MAPNIGGCIYTAAGPSASPPEVEGIRPGLRHGSALPRRQILLNSSHGWGGKISSSAMCPVLFSMEDSLINWGTCPGQCTLLYIESVVSRFSEQAGESHRHKPPTFKSYGHKDTI